MQPRLSSRLTGIKANSYRRVMLFAGAAALVLCGVMLATTGHASPDTEFFHYARLTGSAVAAVLGIAILGIALGWSDAQTVLARRRLHLGLPLVSAATIAIASIAIGDTLRHDFETFAIKEMQRDIGSIRAGIAVAQDMCTKALVRLADVASFEFDRSANSARLDRQSAAMLRDFPELTSIAWKTPDFTSLAPAHRGDAATPGNPVPESELGVMLLAAQRTRAIQTSGTHMLDGNEPGALLVIPALQGSRIRGYLVATTAYKPLFERVAGQLVLDSSIAVFHHGTQVYAGGDAQVGAGMASMLSDLQGDLRVEVRRLFPTLQRRLPETILILGILAGIMVAIGLHFYTVHRGRERHASVMREDLLMQMAERERAQEELTKMTGRLLDVLDSISDAVYMLDKEWRYTYLNPRAENLLRCDAKSLIGKCIWEDSPGLVGTALEQHYRDAAAQGKTQDFSMYLESLGLWCNLRVYPHPHGLAVYFQDDTERHKTEMALRLSEARFRNVARATSHAIWEWDIVTDTVWWSDGLHILFGHPTTTVEPDTKAWANRVHPDDRDSVVAGIRNAIHSDAEFWIDEYRYQRHDGSYAYVQDRGYVTRDAQGKAVSLVGGMSDITDRRLDEERLRDNEEYLRAILDTAIDGILTIDQLGTIMSVNGAALSIFDYSSQQLIGKSITLLMPAQNKLWHDAYLVKHGITGISRLLGATREIMGRRRDGILIPMEASVIEVQRAGRPMFIGFVRDVTQRRRTEQALRQSLLDLDDRNRELRDFAFIASHDLQEPLRKIRMFSDRLLQEYESLLDDRGKEFLRRSSQASARMQTLIDDLLAYSRISTRGDRFQPVDVGRLVATVVDDLEARLESSGGSVQWSELPTVVADATQLRQLFQNLISNALKFRHPQRAPQVKLSAEPAEEGTLGGGWMIRIEDNGIGFEMAHSERIFAPFQRLHTRSEYEGTGIGLAIVRRIAERHGGRISANAQPDIGAVFVLHLPDQQVEADALLAGGIAP
jgi:PAS domain S-box-containing protein